jgi:hypothetical protein
LDTNWNIYEWHDIISGVCIQFIQEWGLQPDKTRWYWMTFWGWGMG